MNTNFPDIPIQQSDKSFRRIGFSILIITFFLLGGWSVFATLESATLSPGVVRVKDHHKTVQHLEGGVVKSILVSDGDSVNKGDLLLTLDNTKNKAELDILKREYIAAKILEARLLAEHDEIDYINYPKIYFSIKNELLENEKNIQSKIFHARKNFYDGEQSVLKSRILQLKSKINSLESILSSKKKLIASYQEEINDFKKLLKEGYVDKQHLRDIERNYLKEISEINENREKISQTNIQIGETQLEIMQIKKESKVKVSKELENNKAELYSLKKKITALEKAVERAHIYSPESGIILGMSTHTIGGVIEAGAPILDIVPQYEELVVDVELSTVDVTRVKIGMLADIRFSALKYTKPIIEGQLFSLSADRLINEKSGIPYYLAKVKITQKGLKDLDQLELLPGMPAEVLIKTGKRTLLEYLLQPINNAFARSFIED